MSKANMKRRTASILRDYGLSCDEFTNADSEPNEKSLPEGIAVYLSGDYDGVVSFGGGLAHDLGNMIEFMSFQSRPVGDFEDTGDLWKNADTDVIALNIAIPTTAGLSPEDSRQKLGFMAA